MRILITGAAGFIGRALIARLARHNEIIAIDRACPGLAGPAVSVIEGDIASPAVLAAARAAACDALVHLVTIPGGAAEEAPAEAFRVNVAASVALLDALAASRRRPRVIFASSVAVFGSPLPAYVDDLTPPRPILLYGAHKLMVESYVATLTRRGAIDGLSLRLPGIVARPRGVSGMKSAFMSEIFHALRASEPFCAPVSPAAAMWLMSVQRIADNLAHALQVTETGTLTLPAQRVTMADLGAEILSQTGAAAELIKYDPDPALEDGFGRYPPLRAAAAEAAGFRDDGSLRELVASSLSAIPAA